MKALPLFLALAACATVPPPAPPSPPSPVAAIGESAVVGGLVIRPLALLEDSRCPASVQCVWAGRVRIRAAIAPARLALPAGPNASATMVGREIDLILGVPVVEFGRTVELTGAAPAVAVPGRIEPGVYRFTFAVGEAR